MTHLLRRHDLGNPEPKTESSQDRALAHANVLLRRAKSILSQWHRLHMASVTIGRYEKIADTGVIDAQVQEARKLVEEADRLCADIDRERMITGQPIVCDATATQAEVDKLKIGPLVVIKDETMPHWSYRYRKVPVR